jgi:hypothetical protein
MAYIAFANGTITPIRDLSQLTRDYAKSIVNAQHLEIVYPRRSPNCVIIVDEDFFDHQQPDNPHASELYNGLICGDVIVLTREEANQVRWIA